MPYTPQTWEDKPSTASPLSAARLNYMESGIEDAMAAAEAAAAGTTVSSQSGTSYTFVLGDAGDYVRFTNAGAVTATIPPNSSVAFVVGTTLAVEQAGAGQVTVAAGSGVTVRVGASHTNATREQYAVVQALKVATDEWVLYGNLAEAP